MNSPATPDTQQPPPANPIHAQLDQSKKVLMAALALHAVTKVKADITTDGRGDPQVANIVATKDNGTVVDLAAGTPITAMRDGREHRFDSLEAFVADYFSGELQHRPEPFLIDGTLDFHAEWGGLSQPISWEQRWAHEAQQKREALQTAKVPILSALAALGVAHVVITYDGEGDGGQIDTIIATSADEQEISLDVHFGGADEKRTLRDAIDDLGWGCLDAYHAGFEINDGGYGEITIDVAEGTLTIDHNDRVVDVSNTVSEV
jgi:hypothetical protein